MHVIRVLKLTKLWSTPILRCMSRQTPPIGLTVDDNGIATITMRRPPVNIFTLEYLHEMTSLLDEISKLQVRGAVLTSAMPNVFAAGLDLKEFYKPDIYRLTKFITAVHDFFEKLIGCDFATAAAISGHAPGIGCLLSLACEYRVMVNGKHTIGLNEAALGIATTPWIHAVACQVLPKKDAERMLTTAKLLNVDEALQIGLIDEIASNEEDATEKCKRYIRQFDEIPPQARALIKQRMRETPLKILREKRKEDIKMLIDLVMIPTLQENLRNYIEKLKNKNKKSMN